MSATGALLLKAGKTRAGARALPAARLDTYITDFKAAALLSGAHHCRRTARPTPMGVHVEAADASAFTAQSRRWTTSELYGSLTDSSSPWYELPVVGSIPSYPGGGIPGDDLRNPLPEAVSLSGDYPGFKVEAVRCFLPQHN